MSKLEFVGDSDFQEKVLKSELPVLIDFYADWCAPCKMMTPLIEKIASSFANKLHVFKVNVDESPMIAASYQIMSIPTILIFNNGAPVSSIIGAVNLKTLVDKIQSIIEE